MKKNAITSEESLKYFNRIKELDDLRGCEETPYKCKCCGEDDIPFDFEICRVCGWQSDPVQNHDPDFEGGAHELSLNQYKDVWFNHREIMSRKDSTTCLHEKYLQLKKQK